MINQLIHQRYEVVEKLGESPLNVVYRAQEIGLNRSVFLRAISAPFDTIPEFAEGLQNGLEAAKVLKHPNIAQFEECGIANGIPYEITEFVRGITLDERIRRISPFSLSVAADYACAIVEALQYAHRLSQAHGDLRPQNIIITSEGALKITGFGIQNAISRSPLAQLEMLSLTVPYRAPELSSAHPGSASGDIYSVGTILYEMLTGSQVYSSDSPQKVAEMHAASAIPSPRIINPGVPRAMEGIIVKCLQKSPDLRYRTATELLTDLKAVRDALRFGKPLSWTPIDIEASSGSPDANITPVETPQTPVRSQEPVAVVAASSQSGVAAMPAKTNRLRKQGENVSLIIKMLIGFTSMIILGALIGFAAITFKYWVAPTKTALPTMIGHPIGEVRTLAAKLKIRLKEHGEFRETPARNIIYKTYPERGEMVLPGHDLDIWYSKGSEFVDVPNVVNLQRDDAEQKLKDAGLVIGRVTQDFSQSIPVGAVLSQDVSFKKRVQHDTVVSLIISEGKKPDYADPTVTPGDSIPNVDVGQQSPPEAPADENQKVRTFSRSLTVQSDGLKKRRVRVEFVDADGEHTPVVDEDHEEGDKIPLNFSYRGKKITLRVYYDDKIQGDPKEFDPESVTQRVDFSRGKP